MGIKTKLEIPDLWFDFYARFLPGITFVAIVRLIILQKTTLPQTREFFVLIFAGYVCAFFVQPFSSRITLCLEKAVICMKGLDKDYVRKIQLKIGTSNRQSMILSKMHGETTAFIQFFMLGAVFFLLQLLFTEPVNRLFLAVNFIFLIIFIISSCEVATRRIARAKFIDDCTDEQLDKK